MGSNNRKRREERGIFSGGASSEDQRISHEKQKARDLRKTPWWRKKISLGKCHYCGQATPPDELTMDHMIPLARGGVSERMNLVPACKECNNAKKYLLPAEWDDYLQKIGDTRRTDTSEE